MTGDAAQGHIPSMLGGLLARHSAEVRAEAAAPAAPSFDTAPRQTARTRILAWLADEANGPRDAGGFVRACDIARGSGVDVSHTNEALTSHPWDFERTPREERAAWRVRPRTPVELAAAERLRALDLEARALCDERGDTAEDRAFAQLCERQPLLARALALRLAFPDEPIAKLAKPDRPKGCRVKLDVSRQTIYRGVEAGRAAGIAVPKMKREGR